MSEKEDISFDFKFNAGWVKGKYLVEFIVVALIVLALLKTAAIYGAHSYEHDSPYQFLAGDMFWLTAEAEGIKHSDNILSRPFFLMGGNTDAYNAFPIGLPVATTELSYMTGVETFDSLFHLNFFFTFMSLFFVYFILRKIHPYVAWFGTPLTLLFFTLPFRYPLNFGAQMSDMNIFLLFGSVFAFLYLKEKWAFVILGLLNGLGFYAHGRESLVFNVGVLFFFAYQILKKSFDMTLFKQYLKSIGVTIISMIPILPVYFDAAFGSRGSLGSTLIKFCPLNPTSTHGVAMADFGLFKWFIFVGIALVILLLFIKKLDMQKSFIFIFSLSLIFNSYFCVLGNKTTQIRHFFPFFMAIFVGVLLYYAYTYLPDKIKGRKLLPALITVVLLLFTITAFAPQPVSDYPVSNPSTWQAFKWIQNNVDDSENILFLYGDNHYQYTLFFLTKKIHASIEQRDFISYLQEGRLPSEVNVLEGSLGFYQTRTSFFNLDYHGIDFRTDVSVCDYDYVYLNKVSQFRAVQQYVIIYAQVLIQENNFALAYENDLVAILQNPEKGGECFDEKRIGQ